MDAPSVGARRDRPPAIRHPSVLCLFAASMGILEAIVVVYLRRIYYPGGFGFPLVPLDPEILRAELIREAMTLIMLVTVAWMAARRTWPRFLAFLVTFGAWDLAYYAGLKLFLGWPGDLMTPDILFLIPSVWVGPVVAPALVAATWVVGGLLLHRTQYDVLRIGWTGWMVGTVACLLILSSFLIHAGTPEQPGYRWGLFLAGYGFGVVLLAILVRRSRRSTHEGGREHVPDHPR